MKLLSAAFLSLLTAAPLAFGGERAIPDLTGPLLDEALVLSRGEAAALSDELRLYPPSMQLQIWIVGSLEGESIEGLSIRAVDKWKLGAKGQDKGALILVSIQDRRARIEVGRGLEGDITDLMSGRIIDHILRPAFREGRYTAGLFQASRALYSAAGGDLSKLPALSGEMARRRSKDDPLTFGLNLAYLIAIVVLWLVFGGRRRSRWGRSYWGGGGGGWGGGSSGGGWSGGGGGFSGGGSSGSW